MGAERVIAFAPELWLVEGPVVPYLGFAYSTRMAIVRLSDGGLFLWSPIKMTPALQATVDALGTVRYLVAPSLLHHLFLADWKRAYPWARLVAPTGLPTRRRDVAFDAELGNWPDPAWAKDIDQVAFRGSVHGTEIVFYHRASRTALVADLIQNFPPGWFRGWRGWIARRWGIVAPNGGTPRDLRASFLNRGAAREAVKRIFAWNAERLVMAHGEIVERNAAPFIKRAFSWLRAD